MKKAYISNPITMTSWNYLLFYVARFGDGFSIRYRKTTHSFCQNLYYDKKSVGSIYIFGLRLYPDGKIHGYVARVYINKNFRNSGNAMRMMSDIIKNFGSCVLHIASVSPNRIDGLTDENREEYRNKLYRFYEKFGFCRTSTNHTGMIRVPTGGNNEV